MPISYGTIINTMAPLPSSEVGRLGALKRAEETSWLDEWWNPIGWIKNIAVGTYELAKSIVTGELEKALLTGDAEAWKTVGKIGVSFVPVVGPIATGIWQTAETASNIASGDEKFSSASMASFIGSGLGVFHGVRTGMKNFKFGSTVESFHSSAESLTENFKQAGPRSIIDEMIRQSRALGDKRFLSNYVPETLGNKFERIFRSPESQIKSMTRRAIDQTKERHKLMSSKNPLNLKIEEIKEISDITEHTIAKLKSGKVTPNSFIEAEEAITRAQVVGDASIATLSKTEDIRKWVKAIKEFINNGEGTSAELIAEFMRDPRIQMLLRGLSKAKQSELLAAFTTIVTEDAKVRAVWYKDPTRISKISKQVTGTTFRIAKYIVNPAKLAHDIFDRTIAKAFEPLAELGEFAKKVFKIGKKAENIEKTFEKYGGILVKSRWILGYKVIESDPTGSMIQISFVPSQTVTEEFRTGKPPVYTKMSRMELLNFLEARSKGEYYLDNIAYGTPGRKGNSPVSFDLTGSGLSSGFLQMLSFMPVTEVRNILGIIKAGIEVSKGKSMFGNLDKYVDGFWKGMQNEISGEMQKQVTENVPHRFAFAKRAARKAISGQSGAKISSSELTRALGVRVKTAQKSSNLGLASVKVMRGGSSTVSGITGIKKIK